jgi:flagellin
MTAINTNVSALNAQYYLANTNKEMEQSMQRLSSGTKVNSAADDAAGLAIAGRMEAQTRGLTMAIKNANDAVSLAQTAEGALGEVTNMLQRIRELAVNSANATLNDSDRLSLDNEVQALKAEIDRVGSTTTFNSQTLLDGSYSGKFQIGDKDGQTVDLKIGSAMTSALGMGGGASGSNTLVSARVAIADAAAGDIEINGQALGKIDVTGGEDLEDVLANINSNVDNIKATGFNVLTAATIGSGVTGGTAATGLSIVTTGMGATAATTFIISASSSMTELAANINNETGGVVAASVNESGKLVLSNNTGASISVEDDSTGQGAGFTNTATDFKGFLKLESTDGSAVRVEAGNKGLSSPGTAADLLTLGFRETKNVSTTDAYTTVGAALTTPQTALISGDLSINGVEIFDSGTTLSDSFQGKLNLINKFSSETGVTASASFSQTFAIDTDNIVIGETLSVNGKELTHTAKTVAGLTTLLNTVSSQTGLKATQNGNNITLAGENVTSLNLDFSTAAALTDGLSSTSTGGVALIKGVMQDTAAAGTARALTIVSGDVAEGRVFNFKSSGGTGQAFDVDYTVVNGDTATTVAQAITNLVRNSNAAFNVLDAAGISAAAGVITIAAATNHGDSKLEFLVKSPKDVLTTGGTAGTPVTSFASIKLDSTSNTPIKIDTGATNAGANHAARHGFINANVGAADFDVNEPTLSAAGGSSMSGLSVSTAAGATAALSTLDNAIDSVNSIRGDLGAIQNRLSYTTNNLSSIVTNTEGAKGRIMDADFAVETSKLAKTQILSQAATSMLAQANQSKQSLLALLQ